MRSAANPLARDPRTTAELIAQLQADPAYGAQYHDALTVVLWRSGSEEYDAAVTLSGGEGPHDRVIAADVLAGHGHRSGGGRCRSQIV